MGRLRAAQIASGLVAVVLAVLVLIGRPTSTGDLTKSATPTLTFPPAESTSSPMSELDADIGSVMVFSWFGALDWSSVRPYLVHDRVGGALLFTSNFGGTPAGLKEWSDLLLSLASSECLEHPLLLMTDWDRVRRLRFDLRHRVNSHSVLCTLTSG